MRRVSTNMANDNLQYYLRLQDKAISDKQNQIAKQSRIQNLRDDPMAVSHSTRYSSHIQQIRQYQNNLLKVQSDHASTETYTNQVVNIMQRINELAVQGAHDTYTAEDKKVIADEINQLLEELVMTANIRDAEGKSVFSGQESFTDSFRILRGNIEGIEGNFIQNVDYIGSIASGKIEVREGEYIENRTPGNRVFWAQNQTIFGAKDTANYIVPNETSIFVDGNEISLAAGDSVNEIMSKVNNSDAAVTLSLDPIKNSLIVSSDFPHEITLEDANGSSVFSDLGILVADRDGSNNFQNDVLVDGGSLFDAVIELRDTLYKGDTYNIGSKNLKNLQLALHHVIDERSRIGSISERMQIVSQNLEATRLNNIEANDSYIGLDTVEAITELKMLEYAQQAAMQTTSKIVQPTLMDFLR